MCGVVLRFYALCCVVLCCCCIVLRCVVVQCRVFCYVVLCCVVVLCCYNVLLCVMLCRVVLYRCFELSFAPCWSLYVVLCSFLYIYASGYFKLCLRCVVLRCVAF